MYTGDHQIINSYVGSRLNMRMDSVIQSDGMLKHLETTIVCLWFEKFPTISFRPAILMLQVLVYPQEPTNIIFIDKKNELLTKLCLDDTDYSHMLVVWGQYIDHDFDLTPQSLSTSTFQGLTNCQQTCRNEPPCFPILVLYFTFV